MQEPFLTEPALLIPTLAILGGVLIALVCILLGFWKAARQSELEARLKQNMLDRGFSPTDIERVIRATAGSPGTEAETPEPRLDNEYALVKKMLDDGHPVEDIDRLVRAMRERQGSTNVLALERERGC